MARYIDTEQFRGKHVVVEIDGKLSSVIPYADIVYAPTADVAPKSEIENYKKIAEQQQTVAMDRYFEIKRLKEELEKAKQAVAREIFEEIEKVVNYALCVDITDWSAYTELKKKYTEGKK